MHCTTHNLLKEVICCEDECLGLLCRECFKHHNPEHHYGIILSKTSQSALVSWIEFLVLKLGEIASNVKTKGYQAYFEMKLNSNYPKGLINQISGNEILEVISVKLEQCLSMLQGNLSFISQCATMEGLNSPGILKDIFLFFLFDTNRNLAYLLQNFQKGLSEQFPHKQVYEFIFFTFVPKELRQLELKRKQLVKNVENQVIIKLKSPNLAYSPNLMKSKKVQQNGPSFEGKYDLHNDTKRFARTSHEANIVNDSTRPKSPRSPTIITRRNPYLQEPPQPQPQTLSTKEQQPHTPKSVFEVAERIKKQNQQSKSQVSQATTQFNEIKMGKGSDRVIQTEIQKPYSQIDDLRRQLLKRERSIKQLNNLINNEEKQLQYRQNQVEMLESEIKKLLSFKAQHFELTRQKKQLSSAIIAKQKSIKELYSLISNEEQELIYRENQVEVLTEQIKKLLGQRIKVQQLETQLEESRKDVRELQNGYGQLAILLGIQPCEEQHRREQVVRGLQSLVQRERQTEMLLKSQQLKIAALQQKFSLISQQCSRLHRKEEQRKQEKTIDEQLLAETIELQAQIVGKNEDLRVLIELLKESSRYLPEAEKETFRKRLSSLKTLKLMSG